MNNVYLKILFLLMLTLFFTSCSRVKFSAPPPQPSVPPSVFELYLENKVQKEDVEAWLFSKNSEFRQKIVSIQFELKDRPVTQADIDRTLALEYDLNTSVHKFNDSNVFWRGYQFTSTIIAQSLGRDLNNPDSLQQIRQNGLGTDAISNGATGTINSFFRNGMVIHRIDLFQYAKIQRSKKALN